MSDTDETSVQLEVCRRCNTAIESRRVPFGKTGRYLEVIGCQCQATRMLLRFENTRFPEDRERGRQKIA